MVELDASPERDAGSGARDAGSEARDAMADAGAAPDAGLRTCEPGPDDYTPRVAMSSTDGWPPCISDDNVYHPIEMSISTIARVDAYERIFSPAHGEPPSRGLLYYLDGRDPSPDDFLNARMVYQEMNGLDSRVQRRTDEHFPAPMDPACTSANPCQCTSTAAANPMYCAGPAVLGPIILSNLNRGIAGDASEPSRVQAARVEAALLWFLYISSYKESLTCTTTARDCDSAWAYYTGGADRDGGFGLAREVLGLEPETHHRIWDGLLAVRCWRDLDPGATATMTELRERARRQQDRALQRGVVRVVIDRLERFARSSGADREAHLAFLRTLLAPIPERTISDATGMMYTVPARPSLMDHIIAERSASDAAFIASEITESDPSGIDAAAIAARLDALVPCP
jgi:hypothetical protein